MAVLQSAPDLASRWKSLTSLLADAGLDQLNYAVLNLDGQDRETASVTQYSSMDESWIDHYLDKRLDLSDPHVRFVRNFGWRPYFFAASSAKGLRADEQAVIAQASEAGLRSQISVIFPDPVGGRAPNGGMTIGSSLQAGEFAAAMSGKEDSLVVISMLFHSLSVGEVRRQQLAVQPLSARERDCLTYLAAGLRVSRIAEQLSISEVTVELHLRNARRKMKASTTAQAVARALLCGEIVP